MKVSFRPDLKVRSRDGGRVAESYRKDQRTTQEGSKTRPATVCWFLFGGLFQAQLSKVTGMREPDGNQPRESEPAGFTRFKLCSVLQIQ